MRLVAAGAHSCSSTFQAPSRIWEILLAEDALGSHLIVPTISWRLVPGAYASVQGKQAGTGERGSA